MRLQRSARAALCGALALVVVGLREPASASEGTKASPQPSAATDWLISERGVGPLLLDKAPPAPRAGFDAAYTATYYYEGNPLEGFAYDDPPATAYVEGAPFFHWGYKNPGEDPPAPMRKKAIKLARAKKLWISMIVVTDPRPKTSKQIGVGDDFRKFQSAYPELGPIQWYPGLWEEPSCIVENGPVWFFFDRCKEPERAKLIRIVVQQPRKILHEGEAD